MKKLLASVALVATLLGVMPMQGMFFGARRKLQSKHAIPKNERPVNSESDQWYELGEKNDAEDVSASSSDSESDSGDRRQTPEKARFTDLVSDSESEASESEDSESNSEALAPSEINPFAHPEEQDAQKRKNETKEGRIRIKDGLLAAGFGLITAGLSYLTWKQGALCFNFWREYPNRRPMIADELAYGILKREIPYVALGGTGAITSAYFTYYFGKKAFQK